MADPYYDDPLDEFRHPKKSWDTWDDKSTETDTWSHEISLEGHYYWLHWVYWVQRHRTASFGLIGLSLLVIVYAAGGECAAQKAGRYEA